MLTTLRSRSCRLGGLTLLLIIMLTACSSNSPLPWPKTEQNTAEEAAKQFAAALSAEDLKGLALAGPGADTANEQLADITRGLDDAAPTFTVESVQTDSEQQATANLKASWVLPGQTQRWTYDSTATVVLDGDRWKINWDRGIVQPDLGPTSRLVHRRTPAERGEITGHSDAPIVSKREVRRIGLDKSVVESGKDATAAAALAKLVDIDQKSFVAKVKAAGAKAFVEAIVLRRDDEDVPTGRELGKIDGATAVSGSQMLGPTRAFARSVLGTVGEASKEIVDDSKGSVVAGDQVGLSGLQQRYDPELRGTPGVTVTVVPGEDLSSTPAPSTGEESEEPARKRVLERKPKDGKSLSITLDVALQAEAEAILSDVSSASAIVAIKPSTGEVLAAANGPDSDDLATATTGQYPPGSTFKVATSLALLRSGLKPDSEVNCPNTLNVDGKRFKNYSDYPSSAVGKINLRKAVAQSCNTGFIGERDRLDKGDLASAAASLGVGADYDVGFPAYFGQVPEDETETGRSAAMIGQGKVLASPLAMAGVAASVSHGKTVLPSLVEGQRAKPTAEPLTAKEAKQLRSMMGAVVTDGSGQFLSDLGGGDVIAKTGTAEYGTTEPFKTHAWMIGAQDDLAVAVFVADGDSGSTTAGPLLKEFLDQASD